MQLSSTLAWLVDAAAETPGADRLLAEIGARLVADGVPLAGGALTLAVPHPLIARRTWLWRADSGEVIAALDAWFDRIAGPVHAFGGEVLKFIGDGVLAIFPVVGRAPRDACDAALRAVSAARVGMAHLDEARRREGLPPLPFGAALHLGEILWGNIGAADRLDFTAIGPAVNLVSRLEGLCRPLDKAVLVSGTFAAETAVSLIPLGTHALRGIASPCAVFTVPDN